MQQKPKKALRGLFTRTEPSVRIEDPAMEPAAPKEPEPALAPVLTVARKGASAEAVAAKSQPHVEDADTQTGAQALPVIETKGVMEATTLEAPESNVDEEPVTLAAPTAEGATTREPAMAFESASVVESALNVADAAVDESAPEVSEESPAFESRSQVTGQGAGVVMKTVSAASHAADKVDSTGFTEISDGLLAQEVAQSPAVEPVSHIDVTSHQRALAEAKEAGPLPPAQLKDLPITSVVASTSKTVEPQVKEAYEPASERAPLVEAIPISASEVLDLPQRETAAFSARGGDVTSTSPIEALGKVVRGFNATAIDRTAWQEDEYLAYIRRIDQAQTEAFLLKGKLLEEVKRRFFEDNKTGWKRFCEDRLDMNYTTANQYIRVGEEFDSVAKERPDFGFEHFKALLPLPADQRGEILARTDSFSVKTLRKLVQERLTPTLSAAQTQSAQEAKSLVRSLEQLKEQILGGDYATLPQLQRWQLAAACQNLSEELGALAGTLNRSSREMGTRTGAASPRAVEERTGASYVGAQARELDSSV